MLTIGPSGAKKEVIKRRTCSLFIASLASPFCVDSRCGIRTRQEAYEQWLAINLFESFVNLLEKTFGDVVRKYDLAVGFVLCHLR